MFKNTAALVDFRVGKKRLLLRKSVVRDMNIQRKDLSAFVNRKKR